MRSRLLMLITIPTLVALVLGAIYIATSVQNELSYQRVERLANLSSTVTSLAYQLEGERDQTIAYIAEGQAGRQAALNNDRQAATQQYQLVEDQYHLTDPWLGRARQQLAGIGASFPAQVQDEAQNITGLLQTINPLRSAATKTQLPILDVLSKYNAIISQLLTIDNNVALGSGDAELVGDVRALAIVSQMADQASLQRGLVYLALTQGSLVPAEYTQLVAAYNGQQQDMLQYQQQATPQQVALYNNTVFGVSGELNDFANQEEQTIIAYGQSGKSIKELPTTPSGWWGDATTGVIEPMSAVQASLVASTISRASALRKDAIITASSVGAAILIVLLLALLLTTLVGRSMVRPLRRLRAGALEVAGVRLPETVRGMSETDGAGVPLDIEPIDVDSTDEIGEVARAFDQVHREALRLASNEAALRGNVNAMFVNLSRRSQSLVERQIRLIDDLEQGEQDPDRLGSLFQMDHLATRMRRNSENLLVLAGHDASRRWNQPVALVDVLRAAVSEIEQYERVTLNVQPGIAVRGHAVNDVVHLLAELAENATAFSSAETPVSVAGHLLSSGGVLLDITDQGVGMGAEEMAHANWRLDNPPVVDVAVSRRMGLFVVARLAARHGIRVRLRPAASGGLTALVWLPDEVISHQADSGAPVPRRFDSTSPLAAITADVNGDNAASMADEINAARAPRFASSLAEATDNGALGLRRIPGAGPHPGTVSTEVAATGPMPVFRLSDQDGAAGQEAEQRGADTADAPAAYDQDAFEAGPSAVGSPAQGADYAATQEHALISAPAGGEGGSDGGWDGAGGSASGVVIPPADHVAAENRLPIFEAVESDWFRRGRTGLGGWQPQSDGVVPNLSWASLSDEGWQAAAAVSAPSTGGTTEAGLPKRVPQANLVPGTAAQEAMAPAPVRSAAATRERFASFQRGSREGRAAATGTDEQPDGDDGS